MNTLNHLSWKLTFLKIEITNVILLLYFDTFDNLCVVSRLKSCRMDKFSCFLIYISMILLTKLVLFYFAFNCLYHGSFFIFHLYKIFADISKADVKSDFPLLSWVSHFHSFLLCFFDLISYYVSFISLICFFDVMSWIITH